MWDTAQQCNHLTRHFCQSRSLAQALPPYCCAVDKLAQPVIGLSRMPLFYPPQGLQVPATLGNLTLLTHLHLDLLGREPVELAPCLRKLVKLESLHVHCKKKSILHWGPRREANGSDVLHACSSLPQLTSLVLGGDMFWDDPDRSLMCQPSEAAVKYHLLPPAVVLCIFASSPLPPQLNPAATAWFCL